MGRGRTWGVLACAVALTAGSTAAVVLPGQVAGATAAATGPPTPAGLTAKPGSASQINLVWKAVTGAASYRIYRAPGPSGPFVKVASPIPARYGDTHLPSATTYYYSVQSVGPTGLISSPSGEVSATTLPLAPTGLHASAPSTSQINLIWAPVSGATSYRVLRGTTSGGPYTKAGTPLISSLSDIGLSAGTVYYYAVQAMDAAGGTSARSVQLSVVTLLTAPAGVMTTPVSASEIDLAWTALTGATGYTVQRSTTSGGPYTTVGSPAAASFADTGLSAGTTFYYVVEALNASGSSVSSAEVSAITVPGAPTGLASTSPSTSEIDLTWTPTTGATGYTVQRSTTPGGPYSTVGSPAVASLADTGLSAGTTYYYVVQAANSSGVSVLSAELAAASLPNAPLSVVATPASASELDLTWGAVAGATGYNVERSTTSGGPYTTVGSPSSTNFSDTGLNPSTTYFYVVVAADSSGASVFSSQVSALTLPAMPLGITATSVSATVIDLTWGVVGGATGYKVERSLTSGGPYGLAGSPSVASFADAGLSPGTTYFYVVQAVNASGASVLSAEASTITIPGAPTGVTATQASPSRITLTWTAVTGTTHYAVLRATTSGGPYTTVGSPLAANFADTGLNSATAYFYVIQAVNSSGSSTSSAQVSATTQLATPLGLAATAVSTSQVNLTWNAVFGATSYSVQRGTSSGGPYSPVGSPGGSSFANTGLSSGTGYFYVVQAVNVSGTSAVSAEVSTITLPGPPAGVVAAPISASEIDLSWAGVVGASGYTVKRSPTSGGPYATIGSPGTTAFADTGLTPDTTYFYVVSAVDASGSSVGSSQVSATTVLAAPTGVVASAVSPSEIDLSWSPVGGATSYKVQRSASSGGPYATVGSPATPTFANTGLSPGTTYFYVVQAVDVAGPSASSTQVSAITVPAGPLGLTATAVSRSEIDLTWAAVAGATGYTVQRGSTSGGPYSTIGTPTSPSFADMALSPDTAYYYVVEASNPSGLSAPSAQATATTVLAEPTGVVATAVSSSEIDLSWTAVSGATSYTVQRSNASGGPYITAGSNTVTSLADTGLNPGTTYFYVVEAVNPAGPSARSTQVSTITVPAAPSGLTATPASGTEVDLTWSPATGASGYIVQRGSTSGGPYTTVGSPAAPSFADTGLVPDTTYFYVVLADNSSGSSALSAEAPAMTGPTPPTGLAAAALSTSQINLTWTAPPGATSYAVQRATSVGGPYTAVGSPAVTSFSDMGLNPGTTYFYEVIALNSSASPSAPSASASAVTVPAAPSGLSATAVSASQVSVTWAAVASATSYTVERATVSGGPYTTVGSPTAAGFADSGLSAATPYFYVVLAVNASGVSTPSVEVSALTDPPGPVGLVATAVSPSEIDLTWIGVSSATGYTVQRSTTSGGPYLTVGAPTVPSYNNTGLNEGATYYYVVEAFNASGLSAPSAEASASTVLATPIGLSATAVSASQINVSWNAVPGATSYTLERATVSGGPYTTAGSFTVTHIADTGLSPATAYFYIVQAVNLSGTSAPSAQASATTAPAAPSAVAATGVSVSQVNLTWTAVSTATSYTVARAATSAGPYTTVGSPTLPSFSDTGLSAGTTYFYVVQALGPSGTSARSAPVSAPTLPGSPSALAAAAVSASQVNLAWSAVTGATSYKVERSTVTGGPYTTVGSPTVPRFSDIGLTSNTTYFYVVQAVDSSGPSALSTEATATTSVAGPTGLAAAPVSAFQINLTWTAVPGATSYTVERSTMSGGPYTTIGSPTTNSLSDTSVSPATMYFYVVLAVSPSGSSAPSVQVSGLTMPSAPSGLAATPVSAAQINLSWTAATGATSYSVLRSLVTGGPYTALGTSAVTSFSDTGLTSDSSYFYVVQAVNASGASSSSSEVTSTTLLGAPTGLSATGVSASAINVAWASVVGASTYTVERATVSGGPYTTIGSASVTSFQDSGLSPGTIYYYIVQAVNSSGSSAFSAEVSGVTQTGPPTGVTATAVSASEIDLTWNPVAGATGYKVLRAISSGGPFTTVGTPTSASLANTGLKAGTAYFYLLQAVNSSGPSVFSGLVSTITLPAAPTGLSATAVSPSQINLTWSAVASATSYTILRAGTSGGPYTSVGSSGTPSFGDSGLGASTTYYYVVEAVNASGASINSAQVSATTQP